MATITVYVTDFEKRLLEEYSRMRGKHLGRIIVKSLLDEADIWVHDNGMQERWAKAYEEYEKNGGKKNEYERTYRRQ